MFVVKSLLLLLVVVVVLLLFKLIEEDDEDDVFRLDIWRAELFDDEDVDGEWGESDEDDEAATGAWCWDESIKVRLLVFWLTLELLLIKPLLLLLLL